MRINFICTSSLGPVAHLVERLICTEEAAGSNPVGSTMILNHQLKLVVLLTFFDLLTISIKIQFGRKLMLKYLHQPVRKNGVYWLSIQSDTVLPLTQRGVVGRMETYLLEAKRFSAHLRNSRVAVRYLGAAAELTGEADLQRALSYWIQQKRRIALQKGVLPRFLISKTWYEYVTAFYDHESMESVKTAGELATMICYFCSLETKRTLEQLLSRYWVLLTDGVPSKSLHEALVILDATWDEDDFGRRVLAWWEYQNETLPALFGLNREGGQLIITAKASSVRWGGG